MNQKTKKVSLIFLTVISLTFLSTSYSMNHGNVGFKNCRWPQSKFDYIFPAAIIGLGFTAKNKILICYGIYDIVRKSYDYVAKKSYKDNKSASSREWLALLREYLIRGTLTTICIPTLYFSYPKIGTTTSEEIGNSIIASIAAAVIFDTVSRTMQHCYKLASFSFLDLDNVSEDE